MDAAKHSEYENKRNEIKKEDKKALPKLIVAIIISGILGGLFSAFCLKCMEYINKNTNSSLLEAFQQLQLLLAPFAGYAAFIVSVVLSVAGFFIYNHYKKMASKMDLEDEENRDRLEHGLNSALLIASVNTVLSWVFFGMGFYCMIERAERNLLSLLLCMTGFILSTACTSVTQQKIVNLEKELNPEKNGSVYDLQFHKKWMKSCDEAERFYIYKCAFASYKVTQITCMVLSVILVLIGMIFPIGILPLISVCIIWGVSTISYSVVAMKVEKMKE